MSFIKNFFTFLVFFLIYLVHANFLEVDVQFSENVVAGGNATLRCIVNCDIKEILSLKWYRGNREFYRYMPRDDQPIKVFPFTVGGIGVDMQNSNATQVTLRNVSVFLSGQFTCEVTTEQNLTTVSAYSDLHVYDAEVFVKPRIKYDNTRQNVLCSGVQVHQFPSKRFSTVFYVDNDKISPSKLAYDNSTIILNTSSLLDWNNGKSKVIRCEVDLPGTTPTSSDEIIVQIDSNDMVVVLPSIILICFGFILSHLSDVYSK